MVTAVRTVDAEIARTQATHGIIYFTSGEVSHIMAVDRIAAYTRGCRENLGLRVDHIKYVGDPAVPANIITRYPQ